MGATLAVAAGVLAWWASRRLETGYIAFTATVGALLALSRFLGERPNFSVGMSRDGWPTVGDLWRFTFTNRSDREWHLMRGYLAGSRRAKEGLPLGSNNPTRPQASNFFRVKPYQPFDGDVTVASLKEQFGDKLPSWAILVDSGGSRHPVRLRWPRS